MLGPLIFGAAIHGWLRTSCHLETSGETVCAFYETAQFPGNIGVKIEITTQSASKKQPAVGRRGWLEGAIHLGVIRQRDSWVATDAIRPGRPSPAKAPHLR